MIPLGLLLSGGAGGRAAAAIRASLVQRGLMRGPPYTQPRSRSSGGGMTATATRTMRALAKTRPAPGAELVERPCPAPVRALLRMEAASICGTDAHLYNWDPWGRDPGSRRSSGPRAGRASRRRRCGVTESASGDLVGVESHIVDWTCSQCRSAGAPVPQPEGDRRPRRWRLRRVRGHPEANAIESNGLDPAVVALQEPMGNAVHAAFVEPIEGRTVAVTGCGRSGCARWPWPRRRGVAGDRDRRRTVPAEMAERMGADLAIDGRGPTCAGGMEATGGWRRGGARDERRAAGSGHRLAIITAAAGSACWGSSAGRPRSTCPT